MQFTSHLHSIYQIDRRHILYIGDRYHLPVTTVRLSQFEQILSKESPPLSCPPNVYYRSMSLGEKDAYQTCIQEQKIANLVMALQKSQEMYEIVFDDPFWLEDHSFYRLLHSKKLKRILQWELSNIHDPHPYFTDEIIYFWKKDLSI